MTVRYTYTCSNCGHEYLEQRGKDEPQRFDECGSCKSGTYTLVSEVTLAEELEVHPAPQIFREDDHVEEVTE